MTDASGEQMSAFIHWFIWTSFAGVSIASQGNSFVLSCAHLANSDINLIYSLISFVLLSITLCSSFLLHRWLTIEPEGMNPLKTTCKVLKFAVKHNKPVARSAFTYWEPGKPSRIDLGKSKYGGPFTNEEVEDVKTCLRMVLIIVSISIPGLTAFAYMLSVSGALHAEFTYTEHSSCYGLLMDYPSGYLTWLCVALGALLYEVFFYSLIRKWVPSTLRRVGLAQCLITIASLILLVTSTIWYFYARPTTCMFTSNGSSPLPVDHNWVKVLINILLNTFGFVVLTAILEFVCAQSPYNLRGLLFGLVISVVLSSLLLGDGVYTLWSELYQEKAPDNSSCGVWFYLFTTILTTLGCVLWCVVAKWYKKRERDEPEMYHIFAENYYAH